MEILLKIEVSNMYFLLKKVYIKVVWKKEITKWDCDRGCEADRAWCEPIIEPGAPAVILPGLPAAAAATKAEENPAADMFGGPMEPPPRALSPGGGME